MEKNIKICLLYDFYSKLLTERQSDIVDMYYNKDFSLGEISGKLGITRQGVRDSLNKAVNALYRLEDKLGMVGKFLYQKKSIENALSAIKDLEAEVVKKYGRHPVIESRVNIIKEVLKDMLDE